MPRKKKKEGEEQVKDGSVILFVALNLILLTLFIYLNSISIMDNRRERVALGSLTGAFGIMPGGVSPSEGDIPLPYDAPIMMIGEIDDEQAMARLRSYLQNAGIKRGMTVNYRLDEIVINFSNDIMFETGSSSLKPGFYKILDKVGMLIIKNNYYVRVEGHTDNSTADSQNSKWMLSANRAVKVLRYLTDNYYLDPDTIAAAGYAQFRPSVPNNSAANRAKNRRVEIVLMEEMI